jgi:2-polyprenyl-3-methyl-5-hydroxy-6-metoxy-1,4-benzoquinol methylase
MAGYDSSYFDGIYSVSDPWRVKGQIAEKTRLHILNDKFSNQSLFGLDIGCGEGSVLAGLKFLKYKHGLDLSEIAIKRAAALYPELTFFQADMQEIAEIANSKYDFISCFETLYYLDDSAIPEVLNNICAAGKENCIYVFSVVTIGRNEHRKYFTLEEFKQLLEVNFTIKSIHPLSLVAKHQNPITRLRNLANRAFERELTVKRYLRMLDKADSNEIYQQMFICEKKSP